MRHSLSAVLLATVAGAFAITSAAQAQTQTSQATNQAKQPQPTSLGEVVVTARRRAELLENVPVAVSAASGTELKTLSVNRMEDLSLIAPGLVILPTSFGDSVPSYLIRGQSQGNLWLTADSPVTTYFAEVPLGRFQGSSGALFDLSSVQVLKGPQGTLFGRNTTGGAIILTPQAPTATFGGYIDASIGNYNAHQIEGAVNIPITDTLQVRVAANLTQHDGYTKNLDGPALDDENHDSARVSIAWKPNDRFNNQFVWNYFHENETPVGFKLIAVNPASLFTAIDPDAVNIPASYTSFHETAINSPPVGGFNTIVNTSTMSDIAQFDLGNNTVIKNIAGFLHVGLYTFNDFDGSDFLLIQSQEMMHSTQWSDELQLQGSAFDNHLKYTAGAFYFTEGGDDTQEVIYFVTGQNAGSGLNVRNTSEAIYAEGTYSFDNPAIDITVGGRYSWDQRSLDFAAALPDGTCIIYTTDLGNTLASPCLVPGQADFHKPTFNVTVDWKPIEKWMVYASYKTGYETGGFDLNATRPSEEAPAGPETVEQVEVGSKLEWTSDMISGRLNLAGFYQTFNDVQKLVSVLKPNNTFQTLFENAAEERLHGVEVDFLARIGSVLDLSASYAYVNAHYVKYLSPALGDLSGDAVGEVVPDVLTVAATWHLPVPEQYGHVDLRGDVYYEATYPASDINYSQSTPLEIQYNNVPSYLIANFRLSWNEIMQSKWSLALYVRNAFNKNYYLNGVNFYTSLGSVAEILGPPRTYGLEARMEF